MKFLFFVAIFSSSLWAQCDPKSKTLNLELKGGPFYNVPRDHQGNTGACYAAVAKNFIVAVSKGKDQASYLDLAILNKKANGRVDKNINGGLTCSTFKQAQKSGFCPQNLSTVERGERDPTDPDNSFNIGMFSSNMEKVEAFLKSGAKLDPKTLGTASAVARKIRTLGRVHFPLPVVGQISIPSDKEALRKSLGTSAKNDSYWKSYDTKFVPAFAKALLSGASANEISLQYEKIMGPVLQQLGLGKNLPAYKKNLTSSLSMYLEDREALKTEMKNSLDVLRIALKDKTSSDDALLGSCLTQMPNLLPFLKGLGDIVSNLDSDVPTSVLFDAKGNLKSIEDFLQVVVAPACLNSVNRRPVDKSFGCNEGEDIIADIKEDPALSGAQKIQKFRGVVRTQLAAGLPLGNTFFTTKDSGHINTIVGMRFNPTSKSCEYLIRESAYGISEWQPEKGLFEKIIALAVLEKP